MGKHPITCHILDTASGKPAGGVACTLYLLEGGLNGATAESKAEVIGKAHTNSDGRVLEWDLSSTSSSLATAATSQWSNGSTDNNNNKSGIIPGVYKIRFQTLEYFENMGSSTFFPFVEVVFKIGNPPDHHYHVPLLLSNFSYSTYRGS